MNKLKTMLSYILGPIIFVYVCYYVYAVIKMFLLWNAYKPLYPFSGEHLFMDRCLLFFGFILYISSFFENENENEDWDRDEDPN